MAIDKVVKKSRAKVDSMATFKTSMVDLRKDSLDLKIELE